MSGRLVQGLNVALALGCLGLAALIYTTLAPASPEKTRPETGTGAGTEDAADPSPGETAEAAFGLPPLSSFREISRRPLFSETRRPAAAPVQAQPAPALDFVLTGIVTTDGGAIAFLRLKGQPGVVRATAGQEIRGWRVDRILPDRIVLRHGDRLQELKVGKPPGEPD